MKKSLLNCETTYVYFEENRSLHEIFFYLRYLHSIYLCVIMLWKTVKLTLKIKEWENCSNVWIMPIEWQCISINKTMYFCESLLAIEPRRLEKLCRHRWLEGAEMALGNWGIRVIWKREGRQARVQGLAACGLPAWFIFAPSLQASPLVRKWWHAHSNWIHAGLVVLLPAAGAVQVIREGGRQSCRAVYRASVSWILTRNR